MSDTDLLLALQQRIDLLESREAITRLIYTYTRAILNQAPSLVADLMTENAVIELRSGDPTADDPHRSILINRYAGIEAIRGSFAVQAGDERRVCPMIHNLQIEVDGETAQSTCVLVSMVWPDGKEYVGEYRDTFRKADGVWRFASRTHTSLGSTDGASAQDAHARFQALREAELSVQNGV